MRVLSRLFRGKCLSGLIGLQRSGKLDLTEARSRRLGRDARKSDWVVDAKKPFGGPLQIVSYLGRYTHRVAISSSRLLAISDTAITFRTRGEPTCSLLPEEFLRRFLLHVLPHQFFKIRHYGLLAPANVHTRLTTAQRLLSRLPAPDDVGAAPASDALSEVPTDAHDRRSSAPRCPHCGGTLVALQPRRPFPNRRRLEDTS